MEEENEDLQIVRFDRFRCVHSLSALESRTVSQSHHHQTMRSTQKFLLFLVAVLLAQQVDCQVRPNFGQTFTLHADMIVHEPPYPKQTFGFHMSAQDSLSGNLRLEEGFTVGAFRGDNATVISVLAKNHTWKAYSSLTKPPTCERGAYIYEDQFAWVSKTHYGWSVTENGIKYDVWAMPIGTPDQSKVVGVASHQPNVPAFYGITWPSHSGNVTQYYWVSSWSTKRPDESLFAVPKICPEH